MKSPNLFKQLGLALGVALAVLAIYGMAGLSRYNATVPSATASRDEQRLKALNEIHAAADQSLSTYGWQNMEKGVIAIPITRAMELMVSEWHDPAWGRSNLLYRASIALEVPETVSPYE